jgi:glycine cleavage system aminomethyltransferase T/glycine/D-amino acid oxidase-like deaminating enzyme
MVSEAGQPHARDSLPSRARVVVVGGGVGGASIAYHLAELGEDDVVLLERSELTSGSTFHSAGLVGQLRADPTLTRMNMYSVELYRRLQQTDHPPSWVESGGIKLASTRDRLEEIRRQITWAHAYGLPLHEISPDEARSLFPLMTTEGVVGAAYLESDGYVDPTQLCYSLAALARAAGVTIRQQTRVLDVTTTGADHRRRVSSVTTDAGVVECEVVVDAAGMFAAEVARMVDVRVPIVPMSHQYLVTESCLAAAGIDPAARLPTLRDPDLLVYWRQEGDGLLMGGYERDPEPWSTSATAYDAIPSDFNGRLLPEAWERFEEIAANATRRIPLMAEIGIKTMINGPEGFTPDNEFCLGETEVAGFFVAAGFCAHGIAGAGGIGKMMAEWVVEGEPSLDLWHMDVSRLGPAYRSPSFTLARTLENYQRYYDIAYPDIEREAGRPLRTSPAYAWHREHGACFGEKSGWERVHYYDENAEAGDASMQPRGWAGRSWSPATAAEHVAVRTTAGLFDETSFAKIEVRGPDAAAFLERVCDNHVARDVGQLTYTQALNPRGGIESDFTVTRLGEQRFWVVTGTAFGGHDLAWLRKQARLGDFDVSLADVTGQSVCFALWGPRAVDILGSLTPVDVSREAFAFMTWQDLTVGDIPARALQVTFTGEHGWELYASTEFGARLWSTLVDAGRPHGLRVCGYRALESLRLEMGYRAWSTDVTPETNPYEAGLGFCVKLDKPGGFVGAAALREAKARGLSRKLSCLTLDDPREVVLGSEPVRVGGDLGEVVGRITSGGAGYSSGASIAYAYLPIEHAGVGARVDVNLFGSWQPATVVDARTLLLRS